MRDALTLDDDVAVRLEAEVRRTGKSLQVVLNEHLRFAFSARYADSSPLPPFKVESRDLGARPGLSLDSIGDLLEIAEGPLHR